MTDLRKIRGIGPALASALHEMGIASAQDLAATQPATLTALRGVNETRAALLIAAAQDWLESAGTASPAVGPAPQDAPTEEPVTPELPGPIIVVSRKEKPRKEKDGKKKDKGSKKKKGKGKGKDDKKEKKEKKKKDKKSDRKK